MADRTLAMDIAAARSKVIRDELKAFNGVFHGRGPKATKEAREEAKELISGILPQCAALQIAMVTGDFPLDKELFDCIDKLLDRGMGKASQTTVLEGNPDKPLPIGLVEVRCATGGPAT